MLPAPKGNGGGGRGGGPRRATIAVRLPGALGGLASFSVTADLSRVARFAERARHALTHARGLWAEVANIARADWRENFRQGGRPAWEPLADSTVAQKRDAGLPEGLRTPTGRIPRRLLQNGSLGAETILIRTGRLRDSLTVRGAPGNVTDIREDGVTLGTTVPYAAVHEHGGDREYTITPRNAPRLAFLGGDGSWVYTRHVLHPALPARPMTTLSEEALDRMRDAAIRHFTEALD